MNAPGKLVSAATMVLLMGCYTAMAATREMPDEVPPRIAEAAPKTEVNRRLFVWDRPSAFGRGPADLQATGDFICAKGRIDLHATGYHPKARDKDDREIPGGGYFCEKKPSGDQPQAQAPRLARLGGIAGWDRPAAFGKVPDALLEKGRRACTAMGSGMEAIGFHPEARNESGQKIGGGGFLCGPVAKS
jgi:hypothetical protein